MNSDKGDEEWADLGGFGNPSGAPANELRGLVGCAKSVKTDWGGGRVSNLLQQVW